MYDVAVELAPAELGLLLVLAPAPAPGVVRLVAPAVDAGLVELEGALVDPLLADALLSMNDVVPVALAPVRGVRVVPVDALDDDVVAPLVPMAPD